ncbi:MAG: 4Fe-4S dicluster domain-containing protein [Gammaproteobacteria bacterium]|nr:4Fe-4S dicluster domain-containing protein [Gammaproteobacteria bacterium]
MTHWVLLADLRACVGCQTCTASCKQTNATAADVQWRRVLDFETGEFPDVGRVFVPVGCMHCAQPPCMEVCPSTATGQRDDGIVTIDYDLCIGCAYCAVACPYQARYRIGKAPPAYGKDGKMRVEEYCEDPARLGVAQKCTFCYDRIDSGLAAGLTPGIDPAATPACVNSCISGALHFGDMDDAESNVSALLKENHHFRMHEELGTEPGFYYLWEQAHDKPDKDSKSPKLTSRGVGGVGGAAPWLQQHWDWRVTGNFIGGGTGAGLMAALAVAALFGADVIPLVLLALGFIVAGLMLVWTELGRPLRSMNVIFHPQTSWMSREALLAGPLCLAMVLTAWSGYTGFALLAAVLGLGFLYCQARMLHGGKGIPIWAEDLSVALIVSSGLVEGVGLLVAVSTPNPTAAGAMLMLVVLRAWIWHNYRNNLAKKAPDQAIATLGRYHAAFTIIGMILPLALVVGGFVLPEISHILYPLAGLGALLAGWLMKYVVINRAAYTQGYAIEHSPERSAGSGGGQGAAPGWNGAL